MRRLTGTDGLTEPFPARSTNSVTAGWTEHEIERLYRDAPLLLIRDYEL